MKVKLIATVFILFNLFGCQTSHSSAWLCNENGKMAFTPPEDCHHLNLSLIKGCGSGVIHLYRGGYMLNVEYELSQLKDNLVIYDGEWYNETLEVEYISQEATIEGELKFKTTFYH